MSRYSKIRSNRANEVCTSFEICSIEPIGKKIRDWSVVNATIVPAVIAVGCSDVTYPTTRYASAGMMEKNVPTIAKNDCPIIVWRIVRPGEPLVLLAVPADLVALTPERLREQDAADTESVSSVIAVRSASVFCVLLATSRRARPTLTVSQTKIGVMQSDSTVS